MAAPDVEDEVARRNVGDEVDDFSPRFDPRLGVGLGDPVIRRADIGLGPTHTRDERIPANKVSVTTCLALDESLRPFGAGFHPAKEAE